MPTTSPVSVAGEAAGAIEVASVPEQPLPIVPATPSDDSATAPVDPVVPPVDSAAPAVAPVEPMAPVVDPVPPPVEPMAPVVDPAAPPVEPMAPVVDPAAPPVEPMAPVVDPVIPPVTPPVVPPAAPVDPTAPVALPERTFSVGQVDEAIAAVITAAEARYTLFAQTRDLAAPEPFFCYTAIDGAWETAKLSSWCSGFVAGAFWFLHELTDEAAWGDFAKTWTAAVAPAATPRPENGFPQRGDQDTGFQIYGSFGLGLLFESDVDAEEYEGRVLEGAASLMADRYNPNIGAFRAWPQSSINPLLVGELPGRDAPNAFEVNIDMMMNVELVLAAADLLEEAGDSSTAELYREAARNHFEQSFDGLIRADGSSYHVVQFGGEGAIINQRTQQGAADDTTWSRGHAWAIYGHAMMHRRLGDDIWRTRADELLDYWRAHTEEHAVPPTDFDRALPEDTRDSSAAAITCSALMDLHVTSGEDVASGEYITGAREILATLAGDHYLNGGPATQQSLLWSCTEKYGPALEDPEVGCIFGDYYMLECMQRYRQATAP